MFSIFCFLVHMVGYLSVVVDARAYPINLIDVVEYVVCIFILIVFLGIGLLKSISVVNYAPHQNGGGRQVE